LVLHSVGAECDKLPFPALYRAETRDYPTRH
jgi:hypothetical protein